MRHMWMAGVVAAALAACTQQAEDPAAASSRACGDVGREAGERLGACDEILAAPDAPEARRIEALVHRGALRQNMGQATEALADFNAALALAPEHSAAQLGKAAILVESGQLGAAEPLVEAVIARGDLTALAHLIRGNLRARWSDNAGALEDYDAALAAQPRLSEALAQRGAIRLGLEDFPAALGDFDAAIEIEGENAVARAGRCWARMMQEQDASAARRDAEIAVRAAPRLMRGQLCLGLAALKLEDWSAARAAYEAAVAQEPGNPEALFGRGVASIRQGDRREGNDDIDQAHVFNSRVDDTFHRAGVDL